MSAEKSRIGLTIVFTGEGKGKTSAALGTIVRALGHGFTIKVYQFIKSPSKTGEQKTLKRLGVEVESLGKGFTWKKKEVDEDIDLARKGWEKAAAAIMSGKYDMVVLDELNYVLDYGFLKPDNVIKVLEGKPESLHVVITGRGAPQELVDFADLVTEMKMVKHPYHSKGIKAQRGVEF